MNAPVAPRFDLLCIGEPMIEFNQTEPGAPHYRQGLGGDTSNVAMAAARSGARTAYWTRLGNDAFGRLLRARWAQEGVEASAVPTDPAAATGVYFVTHGPQGHAFSYLRAGSAASRMRPDELPLDWIRSSRWIQASGISLAISPSACDTVLQAFEAARANGVRIAFDSNLRLGLWPLPRARALIEAAAGQADLFLPSLDDVTVLTGLTEPEAILDWGHRLGAASVALKCGAQGVWLSDGQSRAHLAGHRVAAIDATGAGDCFAGACLARLAAGDALREAATYANAAAALSTTGWGAVDPLPRPDAVRALLAAQAAG